MRINIDNKTIEIEPELLSIFHQPINVFSIENRQNSSQISEYKNLKFNLKITLENNVWNVPYLVQLKKDYLLGSEEENFFKDDGEIFFELSTQLSKNEDIGTFSKIRYLNEPYYEIFKNKFNESVFKLLNYIDTFGDLAISKDEYEFIDKLTFFDFSSQEIENIQSNDEFVIREYRINDIFSNNTIDLNNEFNADKWQIPHLDFKKLELKSAIVFDINYVFYENEDGVGGVGKFEVSKNEGSLKIILPREYYSKYRPNFEDINRILNEFNGYTFKHFLGANIFYGTYEECLSKLNNPNEIYKLAKESLLEREKQRDRGRSNNYDLGDWGGLYGEEAETGRWNTD